MNFKFEPGDVVKIDSNYLDVGENPDTEYIVRDDYGNGKVEVYLPKENDIKAFKGIWTWPDYTMYKVRHVNIMPDGIEYYNIGDILANDKTTIIIADYDAHNRTEQHNLFGHHGTKVTGVISSNHNSDSIAGVAPNLSILEVSAQISNNLVYMVNDVDSLTIAESMSNGIAWAVHNGADVLNCSWKASETNFHSVRLESSIDSALYFGRGGKGCVVIFSSGNIESGHNNSYKDSIAYPANFNPDILVVGAVNQNGSRWNKPVRFFYQLQASISVL